jgi:hypothetical protein
MPSSELALALHSRLVAPRHGRKSGCRQRRASTRITSPFCRARLPIEISGLVGRCTTRKGDSRSAT